MKSTRSERSVTGAASSALVYLQLVRLAGLAMRSVKRLREEVYGHVLSLPMAFFDKAITGQLVSRITNDTEQVKQLYVQVLFVMLGSLTKPSDEMPNVRSIPPIRLRPSSPSPSFTHTK